MATSAITKVQARRNRLSRFRTKEFVSGFRKFTTIQALNQSKRNFLFMKAETLMDSGWTATPEDFDKGTVDFSYVHKFSSGDSETGIALHKPILQVLLQSEVLIEERGGMKRILGGFDNPELKAAFDNDKLAAELDRSQGQMANRKYDTRTLFLVRVLTKDLKMASERPMVLTVKGLNSVNMNSALKDWRDAMSDAINVLYKDTDTGLPMDLNQRAMATMLFRPTIDTVSFDGDKYTTDIAGVESIDLPKYQSVDELDAVIDDYLLPEEFVEQAAEEQTTYWDFIHRFSATNAETLKGMYGLAPDANVQPMSLDGTPQAAAALPQAKVEVVDETAQPMSVKDSYGADPSFE